MGHGYAIRNYRRFAESGKATPGKSRWHPLDLSDGALFDELAPLNRIARRVVLEVTERAAIEQVEGVERRVSLLREQGFRVAVDDLGAD